MRHRARARAQLLLGMLKSDEQGHRHIHVRVPGSQGKFPSMTVRTCSSRGISAQRTAKRGLKRETFICMVQPLSIRSKIKFIMYTGCGHDLVSHRTVEKHDLEILVSPKTVSFQTANGVTDTDMVSSFQTESFKESINA